MIDGLPDNDPMRELFAQLGAIYNNSDVSSASGEKSPPLADIRLSVLRDLSASIFKLSTMSIGILPFGPTSPHQQELQGAYRALDLICAGKRWWVVLSLHRTDDENEEPEIAVVSLDRVAHLMWHALDRTPCTSGRISFETDLAPRDGDGNRAQDHIGAAVELISQSARDMTARVESIERPDPNSAAEITLATALRDSQLVAHDVLERLARAVSLLPTFQWDQQTS